MPFCFSSGRETGNLFGASTRAFTLSRMRMGVASRSRAFAGVGSGVEIRAIRWAACV